MKEAILLTDGYKLDHRRQYPEGTEYVYSNWTPRSCHYYPEASEGAVVFGIQYFIKEYLMKQFQQDFFDKPKDVAVAEFKRRVDTFLGPNNVGTKHIEELHDLGYLPIRIKALPEGTLCPIRVLDDLCDGGGTFVGIAKELRKAAPNRKLSIYVTHMVNPKGILNLSENYNEVYFTNSYKDWQNETLPSNVKVIEIV